MLKFEDNSMQVKKAIHNVAIAWLHEAAGELEGAVADNQSKYNDTGETAGGWEHIIDESSQKAVVGNPLENALWEEFGTGQYAVNGNGRKNAWRYKDRNGNWHKTRGKKPRRHFQLAYNNMKTKIQKALKAKLEGLK